MLAKRFPYTPLRTAVYLAGFVCFGNQTGVGLDQRKLAMSTAFTNPPELWPPPPSPPPVFRMSEEEYLTWALKQDFDSEWVDGEVVVMSPASAEHFRLEHWFSTLLRIYVRERQLGELLGNMMIRLSKQRRIRVPDLFYVQQSRLHIIQPTYLTEAPDLALEIVSPDSSARDWREKYFEYEAAGVAEYWIIDPVSQSFEVHQLDSSGKYQRIPIVGGVIRSLVLPGFWLRSEWFAPEHRPSELEVLRLLGVS